jgi:hypothetical protein
MNIKTYAAATCLAAAALISFSCQTTGSVLGPTIGELDATFAVLDLGFET